MTPERERGREWEEEGDRVEQEYGGEEGEGEKKEIKWSRRRGRSERGRSEGKGKISQYLRTPVQLSLCSGDVWTSPARVILVWCHHPYSCRTT